MPQEPEALGSATEGLSSTSAAAAATGGSTFAGSRASDWLLAVSASVVQGVGLRLPAPATISAHGNNYFCDCAVIVAVILSVVCL